ncbi:MAG: Exonuclease RNase T and DNA polymerase III [Candidatus Nomurabacteria bacterium GW2011_GWA1_37_20]|uniref:Exonuclease RNase T and DNA polymerase III n=1 Tax=Candidatus Nomurabacteria bacterium GW2011_GWA1_37_20 TaxID=1618729 RepID=A0A0G0H5K2_9BACT|nr:MAG: Exonuclease RNase T and DNA polymerase III [Parcubacteria group bacterium GW2011_GWC1_36_9]KKQ33805.1 MAG: Exonuclease RNase T and DNA polymerase III [Candidatus Nomurabacteria bacterium GW2011_GWA1_37_20]
MYKLIFFDTETTGNTEKDFLCQIAYKTDNESYTNLYKPPVKIPPEASAVHHITNKMVAEKESFADSGDLPKIKKLFEDKNSIMVAHNAPFDLLMIKKEGVEPKKFICTLKLARYLDPEEKIGRYNLQYLRYLLDFDIEAQAHDAMGDVLVLEKLFNRLKSKLIEQEKINEDEAIERMIEISSHPLLIKTLNFGKYKGKKMEEVLKIDRGWLKWLLGEKEKSDVIEYEDWIYTLKHYLGK